MNYIIETLSSKIEMEISFFDAAGKPISADDRGGSTIRRRRLHNNGGGYVSYPLKNGKLAEWNKLYLEIPSNTRFRIKFSEISLKPTEYYWFVKNHTVYPFQIRDENSDIVYDVHIYEFGHIPIPEDQTKTLTIMQPGDVDVEDPPPPPKPPQNG